MLHIPSPAFTNIAQILCRISVRQITNACLDLISLHLYEEKVETAAMHPAIPPSPRLLHALWLSRSFPLSPAPKHIATKSGYSTDNKIHCWKHDFHWKKPHSIIRLLSITTSALLIKNQQKDYFVKTQGFYWIFLVVKILLSKNISAFDKSIWQLACLLKQPV